MTVTCWTVEASLTSEVSVTDGKMSLAGRRMKQVRLGNRFPCPIVGMENANQIVLLYPSDPMLEEPWC